MAVATTGSGQEILEEIVVRKPYCEKCNERMIRIDGVLRCPKCGGDVGTTFYKEVTIKFPDLPPLPQKPRCVSEQCIADYKKEVDLFARRCKEDADYYRALHLYHASRCVYCMKHRNDTIDSRYLTGEPEPLTTDEALQEVDRLNKS